METEKLGTHQKALRINLDPTLYGTFAEIGAGQEVARWFFRVGGAAGTIAKTISAYDMTFSDAIYGACERYVSRARLFTMLDHEYHLLIERLDGKRGGQTKFFVYADTVAARSFTRHDESHGWVGIRFQRQPRSEPSQIIVHVRLLDKENLQQQEALSVIGVNLIYGALCPTGKPEDFIASLMDNMNRERIEIDMIKFSGPGFDKIDNRLMSLQLVKQGLTDAAMFQSNGEVVQPAEILYKKPILVERGSFRPVTNLTMNMLECAQRQFLREQQADREEFVVIMEITMNRLISGGEIDPSDFLARVDVLGALGKTVLISNYLEYYRLAGYLFRYTDRKIRIAMGIPSLREIFSEKYYTKLEGGILEAHGRLFKNALKLWIYPLRDPATGGLVTAETLQVEPHLRHLYAHLLENRFIESIEGYNEAYLHIFPPDVLRRIQEGDASWEGMVPAQVVALVKEHKFFGYAGPKERGARREATAKSR